MSETEARHSAASDRASGAGRSDMSETEPEVVEHEWTPSGVEPYGWCSCGATVKRDMLLAHVTADPTTASVGAPREDR